MKRGPKVIQLDWEQFDKLCQLQCTLREIASWFDCSEDSIERRVKEHFGEKFAEVSVKKKGKGKVALRRKQYEVAMTGDRTMLIWLGKQYLEQSDKLENKVETNAKLIIRKTEWGSARESIEDDSDED